MRHNTNDETFGLHVVSLAGSTPLLAPMTDAVVSGKQSQGASRGDTSPISEML